MHLKWLGGLLAVALVSTLLAADAPTTKPSSVLDFTVNDIHDKPVNLSQYKGKVLLIVNTATKCGLKKQIGVLEDVNKKYADQGLVVLGFPANDFKGQEPGTNEEILTACQTTYHVTYPLFSKVVVTGKEKSPLYEFLTSKESNPTFGGDLKWNYTKFLVNREGQVVARFEPGVAPDAPQVTKAIEAQLAAK